ncbi:MAG: thiamine pyrophosphate-dependent enzyme [Eubacteriaceae bacterium]|jgi:2-oxoglutarate ferredoxin oxidoreductase subunit beta|nr:thiamine pyrophosphate-dependent enzyme [Eubacteriaceae bacterium]
MATKEFKAPEMLRTGDPTGFCPGCGHGTVGRLGFEVLDEMGLLEKSISVYDVACDSLYMWAIDTDCVGTAHGRAIATAAGVKRVRKDCPVWAYVGDGASYSIGFQHTVWSAVRNENITVVIINNGVFGMTGGQMAPTTLIGQKTTSSPAGRRADVNGYPMDITKILTGQDIAYLARGSIDTVANINKTKKYIRKAFEKQMNNEGFSLVEVLAPCPTNWGLSPHDSLERIRNEVMEVFPIGEYIERGVK